MPPAALGEGQLAVGRSGSGPAASRAQTDREPFPSGGWLLEDPNYAQPASTASLRECGSA